MTGKIMSRIESLVRRAVTEYTQTILHPKEVAGLKTPRPESLVTVVVAEGSQLPALCRTT